MTANSSPPVATLLERLPPGHLHITALKTALDEHGLRAEDVLLLLAQGVQRDDARQLRRLLVHLSGPTADPSLLRSLLEQDPFIAYRIGANANLSFLHDEVWQTGLKHADILISESVSRATRVGGEHSVDPRANEARTLLRLLHEDVPRQRGAPVIPEFYVILILDRLSAPFRETGAFPSELLEESDSAWISPLFSCSQWRPSPEELVQTSRDFSSWLAPSLFAIEKAATPRHWDELVQRFGAQVVTTIPSVIHARPAILGEQPNPPGGVKPELQDHVLRLADDADVHFMDGNRLARELLATHPRHVPLDRDPLADRVASCYGDDDVHDILKRLVLRHGEDALEGLSVSLLRRWALGSDVPRVRQAAIRAMAGAPAARKEPEELASTPLERASPGL